MSDYRIGDEVYVHGFVDEVRKDVVIIKNEGGYFGTVADEITPSAQPEQRWIPCSERLPEEERKSYWVCTDAYYQCECRWTNSSHIFTNMTTEWHWNIFDVPQYSKVVAWMPLPEPYKGGEQDG